MLSFACESSLIENWNYRKRICILPCRSKPLEVICRELSDLGGTQRQQNLKERSCTEAAPNEETQNGAEKTSAEKRTPAEILGRGRKGNSIRPAIGSE
ncbi:hypothetical protein V6N13_094059 [Hibiscus sabdariffa]